MSEAFDAADVLQFDHVDAMSHDAPRPGEVSGITRRDLLRTGALGRAGPKVASRTLVASTPRSHVPAGRVGSIVRRELGCV
jgi:hypothetical protein